MGTKEVTGIFLSKVLKMDFFVISVFFSVIAAVMCGTLQSSLMLMRLCCCHCCSLLLELFQFLSGVDAWCKMCSDGGLPSEMQDLELAIHHHQTLYEQVTQAYTEVCASQSKCEYLPSHNRHVAAFSLAFLNEVGFPFHSCNSFKDRVRPNPRL